MDVNGAPGPGAWGAEGGNAWQHHSTLLGNRRGGGGSGFPIARPIGIMMIVLAVLAVAAHKTKQVSIAPALFTGILFGALQLDTNEQFMLTFEVNSKLVELGNNLVLFFAGLSCDADCLFTYSRPVLVLGSGYFLAVLGLFALIGWASGLCVGIGSTIFFGVACSLSSRQLMTEHLDRVHQEKTMHGRILLGIAVFQDLLAVLAFTILTAFQRTVVDLDVVASANNATRSDLVDESVAMLARRAGSNSTATRSGNPWVPENVWHDRFRLGDEIGRALGIVALFAVGFLLLNRYVLKTLFHFFTTDGEMLFIGTMAYNFGAAALCFQAGVSPLVGSFLAGLSLSRLPSRVQIQNKVASLKGYGMTTFYFMMGIYVHLDGSFFQANFGYCILVSILNVFVSPVIMVTMGWFCGLKSRTAIYVSLLSNSLGETTLTLQVLAFEAGIFSKETFLNLVVSTMISLVLCCIGAANIDAVHDMLFPFVSPMLDVPSRKEAARIKNKVESEKKHLGSEEVEVFTNHIVILGFNEAGLELAEHFRELKREVFIIDLDYMLHEVFKFSFKGVRGHKTPRCPDVEDGAASHKANLMRRSSMFPTNAVSPEELAAAGIGELVPGDTMKSAKSARHRNSEAADQGQLLFPVDGAKFGMGTNIFSILADPEDQLTWDKYNLRGASLVLSCMWNRKQTHLCEYMKDSTTPLMVTTETNEEARNMYNAGATFCLQQNFFCARFVYEILKQEFKKSKNGDDAIVPIRSGATESADAGGNGYAVACHHDQSESHKNEILFKDRANDHKDDLQEEEEDAVLQLLAPFL